MQEQLLRVSNEPRVANEPTIGKEVQLASELQLASGPIPTQRRIYFMCKRCMDLILAIPILAVTLPLMAVIAVLIKLDSQGPTLFRQVRVGKDGRHFVMYKFRTMYHDSDPELHRRYMQSFIRNAVSDTYNLDAATLPVYKMTRDPRITRFGYLLRRTSLDELPQLINVLKGDMSLVGPRPPIPYEVHEYQEWHKGRLMTTPGMTGWWQVHGRSQVAFDEMVRMDLEYIEQQSLWLDIKILMLTLPAVISGKGAL